MTSEKKTPEAVGAAHEGIKCIGEGTNHDDTAIVGHLEHSGKSTGIHRVFWDGTKVPHSKTIQVSLPIDQVRAAIAGERLTFEICSCCVELHDEYVLDRQEREQREARIRKEVEARIREEDQGALECGTHD